MASGHHIGQRQEAVDQQGRTARSRRCTNAARAFTSVRRLASLIAWPVTRVNRRAVSHARRLIAAGRYVVESDWRDKQPKAGDENAYVEQPRSWHASGRPVQDDGGNPPRGVSGIISSP
jgi:hypothetical protein